MYKSINLTISEVSETVYTNDVIRVVSMTILTAKDGSTPLHIVAQDDSYNSIADWLTRQDGIDLTIKDKVSLVLVFHSWI